MTMHLLKIHNDCDAAVISSWITLCCRTHVLGLPRTDQVTIDREDADCPALELDPNHAELYRVIPDLSDRPAQFFWTSRESLEQSRNNWRKIMGDSKQPEAVRSAAQRLLFGSIQEAGGIEWVLSE